MRYILLSALFFIFPILSYGEELNSKITSDIERLSKDLSDLQQYIYKNVDPSSSNNDNLNNNIVASDKVSDIEGSLRVINSRLEALEIKVSDIYSLFINQNKVTLSNVQSSDSIVLENNISTIVTEKNENNQLGQISLNEMETSDIKTSENNNEETKLIDTTSEQDIEEDPTEDLVIDINLELTKAKNFMATLDNQKAINSLIKIIESKSENSNIIAEAYYWLGRTNYINQDYIESIKYFGIRHRDYVDIEKFKAENYFWLAKSLVKIGDKENTCLVMEDIIFSNDYSQAIGIIEDSKLLQKEQNCGLIID